MNCEMCDKPAQSEVEWGLYESDPKQTAILCDKHSDELWAKVRTAVSANLMHFVIRQVEVK
jgi:hypothetical protein